MLTGLIQAHSGWRYIVILMLVIALVKALIGVVSKGKWSRFDESLNRLTPVMIDIQFVLGIILWIMEQRWTGFEPTASWEHPVTMIVGIALAHITSTRVKKAPTDAAKFQTMLVGYLIAGIVIGLGVARITIMRFAGA